MSAVTNVAIPRWVTIYLWIVVILTFTYAILAYVNPEIQFSHWETAQSAGAFSLSGPLGFYVARALGTTAVGIFALAMGKHDAIRLFLVLLIVTGLADIFHNIIGKNSEVMWTAIILVAINIFAMTRISFSD